MSFTRKIIDGARTGLNTVVDRIAADDTPLSHVDEDALQRELKHRIDARKDSSAGPRDNPRARIVSASDKARQRRSKLAEERAARVGAIRQKRARRAEKAQEDAFRQAKEQAAREAAAGGSRSSRRSGSGASSRGASGRGASGRSGRSTGGRRRSSGFPFQRDDDKIAEYYKRLDLPYGADADEVKSAYRKLMRKYHPDRHAGNPKKQKAATELTMRVTQAYNELTDYLKEK